MGPVRARGAEHQFGKGQGEKSGDFLAGPVGSRGIMQGAGGCVHGAILGGYFGPVKEWTQRVQNANKSARLTTLCPSGGMVDAADSKCT